MKLIYSISDKLYYIQNFLNPNAYKNIHRAIIKQRKNINLQSSKNIWSEYLINNIDAPFRVEVSNYEPFDMIKTLVQRNPFFQLKDVKEMSTVIHYMKKNSGINWHNDGNWKYGATYYLNRRWEKNWGGEFMFTDSDGHGYIPPVGNSLVIIKSPIEHKVNTVLTNIMPRITIQIFVK